MATCKDCLHGDVCFTVLDSMQCQHFKDRARFVELPCKIGDIVYGVNGHPDYGYEIAVLQAKDVALICRCGDLSYSKRLNSFGKTIFLTRESAEQTLKERELTGEQLK